MRVSVETTSGLERRLTVGVPADRVDTAVDKRLQEAARNVRLPGFRPGKVPMRVMQQRFGAGVRQEVLGEVISQSFQEAVISENLRPAGQPNIEARKLASARLALAKLSNTVAKTPKAIAAPVCNVTTTRRISASKMAVCNTSVFEKATAAANDR